MCNILFLHRKKTNCREIKSNSTCCSQYQRYKMPCMRSKNSKLTLSLYAPCTYQDDDDFLHGVSADPTSTTMLPSQTSLSPVTNKTTLLAKVVATSKEEDFSFPTPSSTSLMEPILIKIMKGLGDGRRKKGRPDELDVSVISCLLVAQLFTHSFHQHL